MQELADTQFAKRKAPWTAATCRAGDAIGPFTVGQIVRMIGEFIHSTGTRTTAIRTLTIGEPIE